MTCVEYLVDLICFRNEPCGQILFNIKGVPGVRVQKIFIVGVSGDVVLIREEGTHTAKLQDALAPVQNRQLVDGDKLFSELLIVQAVRHLAPAALTGVVGVDCFFAERLRQFLERGRLLSSKKNGAVTVADNGVRVVLIQSL